ncbi:MAG: leucine-rich repeat domain-containing protein, partial [Clostridia bacterium]|nr:leucine-rich repeat domain-containing protein [Clostridia bacterium]
FYNCSGLTGITIGKGVTTIGSYAFYRCSGLTDVTIPGNVKEISGSVFSGCTQLANVTLGEGITKLDGRIFSGCYSLSRLLIPASVTEITDEYNSIPDTAVIYGYKDSYAQQWAEETGRTFFVIGEANLTLNAPAVVCEPVIHVYGYTAPDAKVSCYVGKNKVAEAKASVTGRWDADISLTAPTDGKDIVIKAEVTTNGKTVSKEATVKYQSDAILLKHFTMTHGGYDISIDETRLGAPIRNVTLYPGEDMIFGLVVSNSRSIEKLYVVSTKDGKKLELTDTGVDSFWYGRGQFDPADKNYVPGPLKVTGITRDGKEFDTGATINITFLIDPSGYVYEAVESNVLEGAVAKVYYKAADGSEALWNAEEYGQLNPVVTLADGAFAWVVPEGQWQVRVSKSGYENAVSEWMDVPPEWTNVYIPMVSTESPRVTYVTLFADHADIFFTQYMDIDSVNSETVLFEGYEGAIVPIDKTETKAGSGVFYAKGFRFTPTKPFTGEVKVKCVSERRFENGEETVSGIRNYAGKALSYGYSNTLTVTEAPLELKVPETVEVMYGGTAIIEISAENVYGRSVFVSADNALLNLSTRSLWLYE